MDARTITVTRYVTPLREGGSLPGLVEGQDLGLYVLKFRGAGQGPRALVAEWVAGAIARRLGLAVPEIVLAELDPALARTEPDPEIQDLIRASAGTNLALDYLPGALTFDPVADARPLAEGGVLEPGLASRIVWFDAFVTNVDRTARNTNMLVWHRRPWLIDHGAALYFQHGWDGSQAGAGTPFTRIADHVLLPQADAVPQAGQALAPLLTRPVLEDILAAVPDAWLDHPDAFAGAQAQRAAYVDWLLARLRQRAAFEQEAVRARG